VAHGSIKLSPEKLQLGGVAAKYGMPGLFGGVIVLIAAVWLGFKTEESQEQFFYSYLAAYSFYMAITLGALAFVMIQHLSRAGWSVTVRRIAEGLSLNVFLMVILALPLLIPFHGESAVHKMMHWHHPDAVAADAVLTAKKGYLNPQFFAIRMGIYFTVWCLMAWFYASKSAEQDRTGSVETSKLVEKVSYPAMIFFGFSLTAFVIDWVMSLNAHWFSTIFGVYYFAGAMLSALSVIVLIGLLLQKNGLVGKAINDEHYHDLGKLMFAFTFFWGYIAFSQYMLIWYANMPEETQFYIPRQWEHWTAVSLLLLIVHLVIPFPGLLSRHVKRSNKVIAFWAVWSLCACAVDQFYLVVPNVWIKEIPARAGNPHMLLSNAMTHFATPHDIYHVNDAGVRELVNRPLLPETLLVTALCFIGIGGLYLFSTMLALRGKSLVPTRDPKLNEALAFENI
jgi:hypothetical protein